MKATKFLTLALAANFAAAVASDWAPANKALVIANALAVLAMIIIQFLYGKE